MYQLAQLMNMTSTDHDLIFTLYTLADEGAEDARGSSDGHRLGRQSGALPSGIHVELWQEMVHVWDIDAAVLFHPGSGQALQAFVWERKRAIGSCTMHSTRRM